MPEESGKSVITIEDSPPTNCVLPSLLPSEEAHINSINARGSVQHNLRIRSALAVREGEVKYMDMLTYYY